MHEMAALRLNDSGHNYGWVSIVLHWLTAAAIIALWIVGDSIDADGGKYFDQTLRLHTTIGLSMYPFLAARIFWRLHCGHPGRLPTQGRIAFSTGKFTHYVMIYCLLALIVSGPLMAWAGALPLRLFDRALPAPFGPSLPLFNVLHEIHVFASSALALLALAHICSVFIHMMIPKDKTFDKIMTPGRRNTPDN
jgi:cytochrome b561